MLPSRNGTDCGVFLLSYALCRAVQIEVAFTQEDMEHLRRQIVLSDSQEESHHVDVHAIIVGA